MEIRDLVSKGARSAGGTRQRVKHHPFGVPALLQLHGVLAATSFDRETGIAKATGLSLTGLSNRLPTSFDQFQMAHHCKP